MNRIKLFGVFVIAGLVMLSAAQFYRANAKQESSHGAAVSAQESGDGETESEGTGNVLHNSDLGNGGESSASEGENSQNGPSLAVNPSGNVVVNGASLVSNSGQSLVVKIFGLNLNIAITSSTSLVGVIQTSASSTSSISDMNAGDVVDVKGKIDAGSGIIAADQVRDQTMQQQNVQSIQQQIQSLLQQLQKLQAQLNMRGG